jgi:hypothetical protein
MRLAARWLGPFVPAGDFAGRVTEAHRRACRVVADDGASLTLASAELGALPGAVTLATPAGFTFRTMTEPGAAVAVRAGILRVAGRLLAIDLRAAPRWRSDLTALCLDLGRPACLAAWRVAAARLDADGRAAPLRALAGDTIARLDRAMRANDGQAASEAIATLIGLGAGRTPDGDDFLVGYLAGAQAAWPTPPILIELRDHVTRLAGRTGDVSRLYLRAAAAGEVGERVYETAAAIAAGGPVLPALTAALAVGHTSGAAGVLGLLHGAAASQARQPPSTVMSRAPAVA